ncbi:uncharacterized protein G2W53_024874 [Senna tora]|uniref:Uncharacterized protein n=1 Tax=Senna tora TaxID=362788 RepID=A0A834TKY7_9FABA|nr:uncharacterized protein G2W53_024874 [Senna tora]
MASSTRDDKKDLNQSSQLDSGYSTSAAALPLPFRLI